MGTKSEPGLYDCFHKARYDEPLFCLLARDPLAPKVVRYWADMRAKVEGVSAKVMEARKCADDMEHWVVNASADVILKRVGEAMKVEDADKMKLALEDVRMFYHRHYEAATGGAAEYGRAIKL